MTTKAKNSLAQARRHLVRARIARGDARAITVECRKVLDDAVAILESRNEDVARLAQLVDDIQEIIGEEA